MNDPIIHAKASKIVEAIKRAIKASNYLSVSIDLFESDVTEIAKISAEALASLGGDGVPKMTSERIKEIQSKTAYPDSQSVMQALMQVWNECEQSRPRPSEREVLVNYADWFEDNKHNLVGETIGYAIDRYLAEKHKTEQLYCHHNGKYTLKEDGTCCKCHLPLTEKQSKTEKK